MIQDRLKRLRSLMKERGIDVYVVLSQDAHQSEYVAPYWRGRAYMSGFNGSAGVLVITENKAKLWTDGRYFLQAEAQLTGSGIGLMRMGEPGVLSWVEWINREAPKAGCVGMDGRTLSAAQARTMRRQWNSKSLRLSCSEDLVGILWQDRPVLPMEKIFDFPESFSGESRGEKLARLRRYMAAREADYYFIGSLEECAWLLNYRGQDIPGTPVAYAYIIVGKERVWLFLEEDKIPEDLRRDLMAEGIQVCSYHAVARMMSRLEPGKILYDPASLSVVLEEEIPESWCKAEEEDVLISWKAVRNKTEQKYIREAHQKDGAVMTRFLRWVKETVKEHRIREDEAAAWLDELRSAQSNSLGISFDTIAGYGPNGAVIHYHAEPGEGTPLEPKGLLLVDSGAQYLEGTTDITRTIALGELTKEEKKAYTLVLKGHIALARAVFTDRTTGPRLDILARQALWEQGMDYKHGTGHGVGHVLSVHEGPQNIGPSNNTVVLEPGMILSDEPGYYEAGQFGVRIENLLMVKEREKTPWGCFLEMETLTLCPYERDAIEKSLLTADEIAWINGYHRRVWKEIAPLLEGTDKEWLEEATKEL